MINFNSVGRFIAAMFVVGSGPLWADVKMPAIFGDHMVLQQDTALPVWGTATAGEKVTVTVGSSTGSAVTGADGNWMVKLTPLPAGTAPLTMTVVGTNTLTFTDVLVGDVWICSGQSNMEFKLGAAHNLAEVMPKLNDPQLRQFAVPYRTSIDPRTDLSGKWEVCTPETAGHFTAVGYFFGSELRSHLNRPIGLIATFWGGTPAQAWTSLDALKKEPSLKHFVDAHDKFAATYTPEAEADFLTKQAVFWPIITKWNQEVGTPYKAALKDWTDADAKAKAAGQPEPPKPEPSSPMPVGPVSPDGGQNAPGNLFNAMINPLIPYAIKGAIWYQGEANAGQPVEYRTLFPTMITDWRQRWGQGDFPFLFVQLAKYAAPNDGWAELRWSQFKTLALPNTGMAVAYDVGDNANIHPKDKMDVGLRLALAAKHVAYGEKLVYTGPVYDKIAINGDKVTVSFTELGGGLVIGTAPWVPPGATPLLNTSLVGFMISGNDGKWVPADAAIEGNTVVVSSAQVKEPIAVRYAFDEASGNLYDKEGLPAVPFRSDRGVDAWGQAKAAVPTPAAK